MGKSAGRLRSIESLEEQFVELDRRMATGADTQAPRSLDVERSNTGTATLRAVEETGKSPYLRLAAHERPVPRRSRRGA